MRISCPKFSNGEDVDLAHGLIHPPYDLPAPKSLFPNQITAVSTDEAVRIKVRKLCEMPDQIEHDQLLGAGQLKE